jgi:hypothetical protein
MFNGESDSPFTYTGRIYSEDLTADMVFEGTSAVGAGPDVELGRLTTDSGSVSALVVGKLRITDGITAPSTVAGKSQIYVDSGTGEVTVKHGDGAVVSLEDTSSSSSEFAEDSFVPTNGQTVFTLSDTFLGANRLSHLQINGVSYGEAYYTIAGTTLTWLNGPFTLETTDVATIRFQTQ